MARKYSQQRKRRMSGDFAKYGFIPARGRIAIAQKPRRFASGLDLCEFTGECDKCSHPPRNARTWAFMVDCGENGTECAYYVCEHCLKRSHHSEAIGEQGSYVRYSNFEQWKRRQALAPDQYICECCDCVATWDCDCCAAEYWREQAATA